ncbi:hypothetical protein VST7929_00272 [Vibrio stylophorae]|uniref:undecaprenyl-diphosphate phosphatase n=1 Tax=Vibrio stylophorae TaxID=659351 RepID=A0ABN8DQ23_9VIBR|nr:phosphatase PAP2 family protein [Vibrio stylophorae]CAH0532443.1 hypothetical protein VST7929_00272 [Vibrio stylophorae]
MQPSLNLEDKNRLYRVDYAMSRWCLQHPYNQQVAQVSRAISHTGDGHLYFCFALLAYWLGDEAGIQFFWMLLAAFAMELPLYWLLKNAIKRDRPQQLPSFIKPSDRYSLPSGHSTAAFLVANLLAVCYPPLLWPMLIWASLIALSRVLLGVHFVSDIIVGALLGTAIAQWTLLLWSSPLRSAW